MANCVLLVNTENVANVDETVKRVNQISWPKGTELRKFKIVMSECEDCANCSKRAVLAHTAVIHRLLWPRTRAAEERVPRVAKLRMDQTDSC